MLIELAIGDAYGAGFEYADGMIELYNDLSHYVQHPTHRGTFPGMYTDDTQMSIAIAEAIVEGDDWTPLNLANRFVACFKRDEREGYASRFYGFLRRVNSGAELLAEIKPDSDKSGAAMRAIPLGVFPTIEEVKARCAVQAAITHNTPDGMAAAQAAALMSHYFIYDLGSKADLRAFLEAQVPSPIWGYVRPPKVQSKGWMSVRAALEAVIGCDRMSELLKRCIAFRGDVDTVATIALGAASSSREYVQDVPETLFWLLENGKYGRDYLQTLDARLRGVIDANRGLSG